MSSSDAASVPLLRYAGGNYLAVPSRRDFIELRPAPLEGEPFAMLPIDVEDAMAFENHDGSRRMTYKLRLTGIDAFGYKTTVLVHDVDVCFDVLVPSGADVAAFELEALSVLERSGIEYARHERIKAKRFMGYAEQPSDFLRIFFHSKQQRRKAIDAIRAEHYDGRDGYTPYQTASDDETCYYRKLSRDFSAPFSDWLEITPDADVERNNRYQSCVASPAGVRKAPKRPERDPTMVMTWDIEAYSDSGEVPMPENVDDIMYMVCCTFHWLASEEPFYRVCLIDKDVVPDSDYENRPASERIQTVVCGSQENLIKAFALLVGSMTPDIITGFNDSGYDWPFVITKAKMLGQLGFMLEHMSLVPAGRRSEEDIHKWCVARKNIKIGGTVGEIYGEMFNVTGYVPIDARVCMVRQFKDEEVSDKKTSLDFYLGINGLPTKLELPYHEQFKIYREGDKDKLALIRGYCDRDAVSCHLLLSKQQIIGFLRIVGELSFLSLWDAHTTANGIKVPNAVIEDANRHGVLMSAIYVRPSEEEAKKKYGGAKVFPPIKGLHNERPTLPFDYASLYPSLMQSFNISPDMYVATEAEASRLREAGKTIFEIDLEYDGTRFTARFVRHDNDISKMGLIPRILVDLLGVRNGIRKRQKAFDKDSVEFGKLEIQQLAVKVLMNSFYGVMGMKGHALYLLPVALAITTAGRMMITMVADYVQSLGWTIVYGDSVAAWTPVVLRVAGKLVVTRVDRLERFGGVWQRDLLGDKEVLALSGAEIWSDAGWTAAPVLIRHALAPNKRMLRVTTGSGVIDVTDDHSLLMLDGREIAPRVLRAGDRILHSPLPPLERFGRSTSDFVVRRVAQALTDRDQFPSWVLGQSEEIRREFLGSLPDGGNSFDSQELRAGVTLLRESLGETPTENSVVSVEEIPYSGFVYDFTTANHHFAAGVGKIVAHNTDSVYLRPPDHYYEELDAAYKAGAITKLEHWTKMVEVSLEISKAFGKEINTMISSYTGNTYLRMEDEGVKFPMLMTGKKKFLNPNKQLYLIRNNLPLLFH
jgi:DNA polymerase elongation subunit (family B)